MQSSPYNMEVLQNHVDDCIGGYPSLVRLEGGKPNTLLHGGSHFHDAPRHRMPETQICPMDKMMEQVKKGRRT